MIELKDVKRLKARKGRGPGVYTCGWDISKSMRWAWIIPDLVARSCQITD